MFTPSRRSLIKAAGAMGALSAVSMPWVARAATHRVVVVGGGPGGAAAAHYLKRLAPSLDVTLIEANPKHYTCFMSNEVVVGLRDIEKIAVGYDGLKKAGVNVVFDYVTGIDGAAKKIATKGGQSFAYDRCIVAPGIELKFGAIPGYSAEAAEILPHAYKAGPQTTLLKQQLEAMPDGGTFLMVAPPNPFRCPPGPYERASLVADYFKRHKPKSKVVILDPKDAFSKQKLFEEGWAKNFGYGTPDSMITWVSGKQGGAVTEIDVAGKSVLAGAGNFKGDVVNVIPPQSAGKIALDAGLAEKGWAVVDTRTFESKAVPGVHVIGDASVAAAMPKSGYAATSQAKAAAVAVIQLLKGGEVAPTTLINTCYSFIDKDYCFSIVGIYQANADGTALPELPDSGGISPLGQSEDYRMREARYAHSWFDNIVKDSWG